MRVVGAQVVGGVGGGGDVSGGTAGGFQSGQPCLSATTVEDLQGGMIDGHTVFADDEGVGQPEVFGVEAGAAIVDGGHGVADGKADFLSNNGDAVEVGNAGVAAVGVEFKGPLDDAVHVLHREGNAGEFVVLEDGQVEDHVALSGEDFGEFDIGGAPGHGLLFIAGDVRAEAANAGGIGVDGEAAGFEIASVAIPDENVAGLDAGLLEALGDGEDESEMGGDAFATETVGFETDDFIVGGNDAFPSFDVAIAPGVGGDGSIEQIDDALFVKLAGRIVESGIAGDNDFGFIELGVLGEAERGLGADKNGRGGCGLQEITAGGHWDLLLCSCG